MKDTLTRKALDDLLLSYRDLDFVRTDLTVSCADEQKIKDAVPTFSGIPVVNVWIDPTLKQGECYWGRPDPERLGERFKGYLVSGELKEAN